MNNVIRFNRPVAAQRADGVAAVVAITARRMGFDSDRAIREAASARRAFLSGRGSAAGIVATYTGAMRESSPQVSA